MRRRPVVALIAACVAVALLVTAAVWLGADDAPNTSAASSTAEPPGETAGNGGSGEADGGEARGGAEELQEQQEATAERLEALERARDAGTFGTDARVLNDPAAGWTGEVLVNKGSDDWEPAIAIDQNASYVYMLITRYGKPKPCPGNCPTPFIELVISSDGGRTWDTSKPLCACKGSGQYDPIIETVPSTGDVYALFMNGFNVVFIKSADHGKTWSTPVETYGKVSWNDKPILTTDDTGKHIYVSWNGPQGGDPWLAQSHDYGRSWTQTKLVQSKRYYFAYDGTVLSDGTVVISEGSISYTGPGASPEGKVWQQAFVSRDRGTTWENQVIDKVAVGEPCVAAGCSSDFYIGHSSVSSDANDHLVYAYDGATKFHGPQRIYVRRSTDEAHTWSDRVAVSTAGEMATAPAIETVGNGDVRLWFYQTRDDDTDRWNVWYRTSADGGRSWSSRALLSDATSGPHYKRSNPDGFLEVYGDYGEIGVTNRGKTVTVWGEGFSWTGPGGVWFNREL